MEKYKCKICNKRLKEKGDICTNCYMQMDKYPRIGNFKNKVIESITTEDTKKLCDDKNEYKIINFGKSKEKAIQISNKYNYLRNNLIEKFELNLLTFAIFLYFLGLANEKTFNLVLTILVIFLYVILIIIKNRMIKKNVLSERIYLLSDKIIKQNNYFIKRKKQIKYKEIVDVKMKKAGIFRKSEVIIYAKGKEDYFLPRIITIENICQIDKFIDIFFDITKLTQTEPENASSKLIKKSFLGIKEEIEELKENIQNNREIKDKNK